MIIGITGLVLDPAGNRRVAGAGKDTVCDLLYTRHRIVKVALADPIKRMAQDALKFSYAQLWGPSALRNEPDSRYVRMRAGALGTTGLLCQDPEELNGTRYEKYKHLLDVYGNMPSPPVDEYLTPRYALQQLGTEWARSCYANTWVDYGLSVAKELLEDKHMVYVASLGVVPRAEQTAQGEFPQREDYPAEISGVSFSDMRFFNEYEAVRAAGGKVVRVLRRTQSVFDDALGDHQSEKELVNFDDDKFDYVIDNNGSLSSLSLKVDRMMDVLTGRLRPFDEEQANVPPFLRKS